jgi:hypothetical protein
MRTLLRTLTVGAGALALAATVSASQAAKKEPAKSTAAPKTAAMKPAGKSATGKISKYDAATHTLTVTTPKGDENFVLSDKASLHAGSKTITADDLGSHAGQTAKIRYSDANGTRTAEMVTVAAAKGASKSVKKSGK